MTRPLWRLLSLTFIALLLSHSLPATEALAAPDLATPVHHACASLDLTALHTRNRSNDLNSLTAQCCGTPLGAAVETARRLQAPSPADTTTLSYRSILVPTPLRPPM